MFNKLWKLLTEVATPLSGIGSMKDILMLVEEMMDFVDDHPDKDSIIDSICQILQEHKDKKDGSANT